jgi:hypothetical protein
MLLASPPGGSRPIRPFSATPIMANVRAGRLLKIPAEPSPELRIPGAAAQTRAVSVAGIRLGSGESARGFKGIICDDISEFESHMPSHAVWSLWACLGCGIMRVGFVTGLSWRSKQHSR